jgi:hypothetical protein
MKTETIENILNFIKEKENKELPKKWKLIHKLENHPDGTQYKHYNKLDLSYSIIRKLPDDLYVGGYFNLDGCKKLTKLPDKLYVEGSLNSGYCQQLTELPDNLYVGTGLSITKTNIEEIPNNLYVGGVLYIRDTPLANKYTNEEIIDIITSTGGEIIGGILR